jgi:hypothetical protein
MEASMMQSVICDSHVGRHRPFSSQISPDQGTQRILSSPQCKGAHRDLTPTRNSSAAKPGSSQLRRREAFLQLARSQYIEAMPRQSLHCRNHRGASPRVVMVRRRGEGAELEFMIVSRPIRRDSDE